MPLHHRRGLNLQCAAGFRLDVALAVDRLAQWVDHTAEELVADRDRENLAGALDLLTLFELFEVTQDDRADAVFVQVERDAEDPAGELQELLGHHRRQTLNVCNAVPGINDGAHFFLGGV